MGQLNRFLIFVFMVLTCSVDGLLVVGPKSIRANQNYNLVISNFNSELSKVDLMVKLEGQSETGENVFNMIKTVEVRRQMNRMIPFKIPGNLSPGSYKITIDGQRGFDFFETAELMYSSTSMSGLIQIDKPVFKPGDTVKFRVIVLDTELKPPASVKSVQVTIRDPQNNMIRKWSSAKLYAGVFENELQLAPSPMLGIWNIVVMEEGKELVSKTFDVKEYVLPSFYVQIRPTKTPLIEHQALNLMIKANYPFGKPVQGVAKVELYLNDGWLDQTKEVEVYGMKRIELQFKSLMQMIDEFNDVRVKVLFTEKFTNRTVVREEVITIYEHPFRVELITDSSTFHQAFPFKCTLKLTHEDGTPAADITGIVEVHEIMFEQTFTSDDNGLIRFVLQPDENINSMNIQFTKDIRTIFEKEVTKRETSQYIKLELTSPLSVNRPMRLLITSSEQMTFFVYYVVSKGNIIDSGFIRTRRQVKYVLKLTATEKMMPKSHILVATVANKTVVFDHMEIKFEELRNNFRLSIDEHDIKPGRQIELRMSGRPGAYVGLAAYDKGLLAYGGKHDLFWQDVIQLFDSLNGIDVNEYDPFHSIGLFARTLGDMIIDDRLEKVPLDDLKRINQFHKLVEYRTDFSESWLWQNLTLEASGRCNLIENVPDATTSWYLTGFSIDPLYGIGTIKQPIQLDTVLPFFIVDNLPYSIKRDEAVVLQFTLFNNLQSTYTADVTLYNVANQIEFVGRTLEETSFTKSLSVPPNVGVPVSFLVKSRKLGEMVVRVKASTMDGQESDALEKVIRVMPESIVQSKIDTRYFCLNYYNTTSFSFNLDIHMKADKESKQIKFRLETNLLSSFIENPNDLIQMPLGCGEGNMAKMLPHIFVLEHLKAIGSNNETLVKRTKKLLDNGYQDQLRYRQSDGAFGVWHNDNSVFVTALVAKSMLTATNHIDVDLQVMEKAFSWLVSKQDNSTGRFDEVGEIFYKELQNSHKGIALTSYVLVALLENSKAKMKHAEVIEKGMRYLSDEFNNINNAYDLAITTYAMMLNNHIHKEAALEKLIGMSAISENEQERHWNTAHSVETTSYALLSIVLAERFVDGLQVMRWLVKQRSITGAYNSTQETFLGMQASTAFIEKISPAQNDYNIEVKYKEKIEERKQFIIEKGDTKKYEQAIPAGLKNFNVTVNGIGFGILQAVYQYSLELKNFKNRFDLTVEKNNTRSNYKLRLRVCANYIPQLVDSLSNLALIEVNFPSGYVVDRNPISEQTTVNPIQNIEIRYGGTSVVLYYSNMGRERNCFTATAYRRFKVALKRPAYVVVYDYYNRNLNAIQVYEVDKQNVCEICEKDDCPLECRNNKRR